MSQVLENLRNVDPNNSDAVKEVVTAFYLNLPKHTEVNCNVWLVTLESVITRFPRYCAQHRSTIENYIAHFLDSSNYHNVVEAAKCAHGLQQIRPSQDKAATAKNCWREQMSILCTTAHKLIDALFSSTIDIYKGKKNIKKLNSNLLSSSPLTTALNQILNLKKEHKSLDKNVVLCNKLRNVFVFIQAMLVEVYPVAKPIQPQLILEVIVQALSVSSSVNTNVIEASTVKIQALRTLDAIISCLGTNLIPFSSLVFKCVMQTLRWSSDNPSEESRKVRCSAYESLNSWLYTLHVYRVSGDERGRSWEDEITNHILADITPAKKCVQLTMSNQYTKNLSKKARKKLANTMLRQSSIASHMPGEKNKTVEFEETNDEVANAALECAAVFLTVCGIFLKPVTHKSFQERLVRDCFNLDNFSASRSLLLLRALDACRKNTPPTVAPPTHYLLLLYSTLVNNSCDEIKKFSTQALLEIRLHLHCSPPSLNFALEVQEKKTADDNRKRISEANRAALESLLGKDRMPPTEEVITIADEPSNKRPRLQSEAISENISLSSDSVKSIEISDDDVDDIVEIQQDGTQDSTQIDQTDADNSVNVNQNEETNTKDTVDSIGNKTSSTQTKEINDNESEIIQNNIYEAKTQMPNVSLDSEDRDASPISMEVVYDPNAETKVIAMEKPDEENIPSSNEKDVLITCGQAIPSSQESVEIIKVNGVNEIENIVENGVGKDIVENIEVKITTKEITVDDMLADFVDEVNEESKTEA